MLVNQVKITIVLASTHSLQSHKVFLSEKNWDQSLSKHSAVPQKILQRSPVVYHDSRKHLRWSVLEQ